MSEKRLRNKKNKKRKRKGAGAVPALRFIVLLILLVFVSAVAFLPVETITVSGNHHESAEEVRAAVLERAPGESLVLAYLMNNGRGAASLPFVESLAVSVADAKTLGVAVTEKAAAGCFTAQSASWYFDAEGNLLFSRPVPEEKNEGHFIPLCEGIRIPKEEDSGADKTLSAGMNLEIRKSFFADIAAVQSWCTGEGVYADLISFDEGENMTIFFGEIEVKLGSFNDISPKLEALSRIMPEIQGRAGTLDLRNIIGSQKDVHFYEKKS